MYFLHTRSVIKKFKQRFYIRQLLTWLRHRIWLSSESSIYRWKLWKNGIIFGADMNSSVYVDDNGQVILIFGEGPTN